MSFSFESAFDGARFFAFSRASKKRSMPLRAHEAFFTSGGATADNGRNDQNFLPSSTSITRLAVAVPSRGSGAPASIHLTKSAMTASDSLPDGGIFVDSYF